MTPTRPNTVGHVRPAATTGQPTTPMATSANMAADMATHHVDNTVDSTPAMSGGMAGGMATDTTNMDPVALARDTAPASGGTVTASAGALAHRALRAGRVSPVVAVVGLLVGLSWCLPTPAPGAAVHLVSTVVGAWRPTQALGAVLLAQQGDLPGSQITLEQFGQNVQWLIIGFLATLTITFFMIGFAQMIAARGQSEEYGKAKESLKSSLKGFLGVMLTPALFGALQSLFTSRGGR